MLFTGIMSRKTIYSIVVLIIILVSIWMLSNSSVKSDGFSERVKISLRNVGHQLLLSNQDSTSLVLPVVELDKSKYRLSFQQQVSFEPSRLVSITKMSFQKSALPEYYRVEVIQCTDQEVAYSYEMSETEESTIIPCASRSLPAKCYIIEVMFTKRTASFANQHLLIYILVLIVFILIGFFFYNRKHAKISEEGNTTYVAIGSFQFYQEQNKLVKEAIEISLSNKECELLTIFVANPNQIIKRDELTKKVWEDNGVFVSRSLDTYISKLRKKLKADDSIKLINVHGVGYKLEINY